MDKLETRFVDGRLIENRGFSQAHVLFGTRGVVLPRRQREASYAGNIGVVRVFVAGYQGVIRIDLIINSRAEFSAPIWCRNSIAEGNDIQICVKNGPIDHGIVVDVALLEINKERSLLLGDRAAEIATILSRKIRRPRRRKWIARVQRLVIEAKRNL